MIAKSYFCTILLIFTSFAECRKKREGEKPTVKQPEGPTIEEEI